MLLNQLSFTRRSQASTAAFPWKGLAIAATFSVTLGLSACTSAPSSVETGTENTPSEVSSSTAETTVADPKVYEKEGVAISGADPVAYFTEEGFVPGSAEHTYEWRGATWQFASAENRELFACNPEEYAPQYGGYCAWAVGQNTLAAIDPNAWSIVDGKLYLNANKRIQERWNKDIPGNIALAEENWPTLSQQ